MEMTINLSKECVLILEELVKSGIYGASSQTIAERFIEYGVQAYVDRPSFSIPLLIKEDRLRKQDEFERERDKKLDRRHLEKLPIELQMEKEAQLEEQLEKQPIPGPYPDPVKEGRITKQ